MYKMRKAGSLDYDTLGKLLRMIEGALFTREFLLEGIRETEVWRTLDDVRVSKFCADAKSMLTGLSARKNPNEAQTEEDLVYSTFPILEREQMAAHGRYLSRDLCLLFINALAANDPNASIIL
jgi:hypothetical protein